MDLTKVSTEDLQKELFLRHPFTEAFATLKGVTIEECRINLGNIWKSAEPIRVHGYTTEEFSNKLESHKLWEQTGEVLK